MMFYQRRKNPDTNDIQAKATERANAFFLPLATATYNEELVKLESEIKGMSKSDPDRKELVEFYKSLDFDTFVEENRAVLFESLRSALYEKFWKEAVEAEAARPSSPPFLPSTPALEEPSSALHDEPTSAVLPSSPSLEEPRSEAPFEASDCESQLFSPESVKALLASVDPKYKRETCHVLNRIESLMIERMGAELSGVLG